MTQNQQIFNAAAIGEKFQSAYVKFENFLVQGNNEKITDIRQKLHQELKAYREDGVIRVAFVGQYSAGKSTIISALTGRRDIKIDADIATERTTSYAWNGIKLIDTPGLFTGKTDHDEITYETIDKADLLVFCLTYMLFDSFTVDNFKKLAYDKGYRWKMMLVINKMSDEAGEEETKIANYRQSLAEAIKPYTLDEFPVCFIDAKDYCEGIDEADNFLLEISRFPTFINALNKFVDSRSALARFDTPVRIALSYVNEAQVVFTPDSNGESAFVEILNQLSRKVRKERDRLRTKVQGIALEMSSALAKEGTTLAAAVGVEQNFEILIKQAELNVQKHYEKAESKLQDTINTAVEDIRQEVEEVLSSSLTKTFVAYLEKTINVSATNASKDVNPILGKVSWIKAIKDISQKAGVEPTTLGANLTTFATRSFANTSGQQVFLRSMDVAGSGLHQGVLAVGKFVGFKFKPWQAVGVAKNVGNFAKFLGPVAALGSVGIELIQMQREHQREKEMADIRRDITSQFQALAKDLENQIQMQLYDFEKQVYEEIEKQIAAARCQQEEAIAASNTWVKQLAEIRKDFEAIISYVTQATETMLT